MKHFRRYVAATVAAAVMAFAAAPASAIVDENGNVVGIIITEDGRMYY
jgi:hypothetical protein